MKLKRVDGIFILELGGGFCISFKKTWIDQLKTLPYDTYGEFIRANIYPVLSLEEKKIWNKNTISNRDLQTVVLEYADNLNLISSS